MRLLNYAFGGVKPSLQSKILVMCNTQATTSDLPVYKIFVPQKVSLSKISDDMITCDLWFAPPPIKNPDYVYGTPCWNRKNRKKNF